MTARRVRVTGRVQGVSYRYYAQQEAVTLVPSDARVLESFVANYAQILHGSQIDRYQSSSLPARFKGDTARSYTRNFVIMYELSPAPDAFDYYVTRYFVIAGTRPPS